MRRCIMRVRFAAALAIFIVCFVTQVDTSRAQDDVCKLPATLQPVIASTYPGGTLLNSLDLSDTDRLQFQKGHGNECPGVVSLNFYGDGKPTLALVLIVKTGASEKAQLVLAHRVGPKWVTSLLEEAKSSRPVVWSQRPGEYEDVYGDKKIRATKPVIVFCGYNSWAVLYAWTGSNVEKIWLED
jgi:hypothetical protein